VGEKNSLDLDPKVIGGGDVVEPVQTLSRLSDYVATIASLRSVAS